MNKRYLGLIAYGIPGLFIAFIASIFTAGIISGIFWIFIFGDESWPSWTNSFIIIISILVFIIMLLIFLIWGYRVGRRLEQNNESIKKHFIISLVIILVLIILIIIYSFSVGNLGSKSISILCNDFCIDNNYSISEIPHSIDGDDIRDFCRCLDNMGKVVKEVPLRQLKN